MPDPYGTAPFDIFDDYDAEDAHDTAAANDARELVYGLPARPGTRR